MSFVPVEIAGDWRSSCELASRSACANSFRTRSALCGAASIAIEAFTALSHAQAQDRFQIKADAEDDRLSSTSHCGRVVGEGF
jgi:hypothetical protein